MKATFKNETRLGCACHNLNLVLLHEFKKSKSRTNFDSATYLPEDVAQLVDNCKELVTLARALSIGSKLYN